MKIIILGANQISNGLTEYLVADNNNDLTVIDSNIEQLQQLQDRYDLKVVHGHPSHPQILDQAGASSADILLALTLSDEINIIACQIAYALFNTPNRIARIRSQGYRVPEYEKKLFVDEIIPIKHVISPEELVAESIYQLIEHPGALQLGYFAGGAIAIVSAKAYYGGPLVGEAIYTLQEHIPHIDTKVIAIARQNRTIKIKPSTIIEAGDEVFFIVGSEYVSAIINELQRLEKPYKRILIVGGGQVGTALAKKLEQHCNVKLIESNPKRVQQIVMELQNTIIFQGSASDRELLIEENIEQIDLFIAVTNDDGANILSSMLAKRLGVKKCLALIQSQSYSELVEDNLIDITVTPQQLTVSAILSYLKNVNRVSLFSLDKNIAEAVEITVSNSTEYQHVIGKSINQLDFPNGVSFGALHRNREIYIREITVPIQEQDRLILFITDRKYLQNISALIASLVRH